MVADFTAENCSECLVVMLRELALGLIRPTSLRLSHWDELNEGQEEFST